MPLLLALAVWVAHLALRPVEETDLFFRLAAGAEVWRRGGPFHENLFSFTFPNHPYLDSAWLFDLLVARLHRLGGFAAIVIGKTAVLVAVFTGAWAVARRRGVDAISAALVLGAAAFLVEPRMVERPHLFSFAGEIALLGILQTARTRPRVLWLAVPMTAVWANLHAGAFIAPLILAASATGALIDRRRFPAAEIGPGPARLAAAALGATGALLATPVGVGIFQYLAFHVGIHGLHPVDEFRPPDLTSDAPLLLGAAAIAVGLGLFPARLPVPAREILPLLALGILAARSVRFGADAILLTAPLLAGRASQLWALAPQRDWFTRRPDLPAALAAGLAAGTVLAVAALRITTSVPAPPPTGAQARLAVNLDVGLAPDLIPSAALAFIEAHHLEDRMYNDFEMGGYLAWRWYPRHRVFVDPRLPAYPRSFHQLLGRADLTRGEWDRAMQSFAVDSALLTWAGINARVAWWDPERWALVFRGQDARVFLRRLPRWRDLIAAYEIPATFAFSPATGTLTMPLLRPPAASPVAACEWHLRVGDLAHELDGGDDRRALQSYAQALTAPPDCLPRARRLQAAAWLGAGLLAHRRWAEALPVLDRAISDAADDAALDGLLANRALALESLGRRQDAAAAWRALAKHAPAGELADKAAQRAAALAR